LLEISPVVTIQQLIFTGKMRYSSCCGYIVACSAQVDLIFVVDASDSIRIERFPQVINLIAAVVDQMDIGPDRARVGLVKFANTASVQFQLNTYSTKQSLISAIKRVLFVGGRTNVSGAIWYMVRVATFSCKI
jgi:Mg-chelatase subunit ChlD